MIKKIRIIILSLVIAAGLLIPLMPPASAAAAVAKNVTTGTTYTSVASALSNARNGQTVMLIADAALTSSAEVKSGVTLLIPYKNANEATEDGTADNASKIFGTDVYRTLTINQGVTLTVKGTLTVGGIIGYPGVYYQGHTSGDHGKIVNNGTISVTGSSAVVRSYGFIEGSGTLNVGSGSKVYEPFVVLDYSGGTNTRDLNSKNQPPFTQYTMQNISCAMTVSYGGKLYGMCNLYASSQYNKTEQMMIGQSSDSALIKLVSGASVTRTVDKSKYLSGATAQSPENYGHDIGKVKYTISGGATFGSLTLRINVTGSTYLNITVNKLTIPYCLEYELQNGTYTTSNTFYVMPGGVLSVGSGAAFNLNGTLYVFDGLRQGGMGSGQTAKHYPSTEQLSAAGFATNGVFVVNGSFTIGKNTTFGGIIQTESAGATVTVNAQAKDVAKTDLSFGAETTNDDNSVLLPLKGRLLFHNTVTDLVKGKTYNSYTGRNWVLEGYDITGYMTDDGTYEENVHVATNQSMKGEWTFTGHTIVTHPGQAPGCTTPGYEEYYTCSQCPDYNTYAELAPLGHDYDEVTVLSAATYTQHGVVRHTCSRCGDYYDEETPLVPAASYSASLTLDDSININFFVKNVAQDTALEDYSVVYTFCGTESTAEISHYDTNRIVVARCATKEIGDIVNIKIYYQNVMIREINYSARQYCENKIANSSNETLKAFCRAALDLGAYSQIYFDHNPDNLVNSVYSAGTVPTTVIPAEVNAQNSTGSCSGISSLTASLNLESKTELNFNFVPSGEAALGDITVTLNGTVVTSDQIRANSGGSYTVTVNGICAKNLGDVHTISIIWGGETKTVEYSPLTWAYKKQNSDVEKTRNLAKALYNYYVAATAYIP